MKKKLIVVFFFLFLISYLVLKRSYHTKILPFQSVTLNCVMNGAQNFPSSGSKYAPIVKLPKIFKIKFGYGDGEFIKGENVLIENYFLKKKTFGYQYSKNSNSIFIQPTYTPSWIGPNDPPGELMLFIFPLNPFNQKREDIWVDYVWRGGGSMRLIEDYDAHYKCENVE